MEIEIRRKNGKGNSGEKKSSILTTAGMEMDRTHLHFRHLAEEALKYLIVNSRPYPYWLSIILCEIDIKLHHMRY